MRSDHLSFPSDGCDVLWRSGPSQSENRGDPTLSQIDTGRLLFHQPFPPPPPKTPVTNYKLTELIYMILNYFFKNFNLIHTYKIDQPIVNHMLMIEHLFVFSSYVFILSDLKCYGNITSSFLNYF